MISHKLFGTQDFFAAPVIDNIFITTDGVWSKIELESWTCTSLSYTHLTLQTICSV